MDKRKAVFAIVAGLAIFFGFGMIHAGKPIIETTGSGLIGVGSLYFLVVLFRSLVSGNAAEKHEEGDE